MIDLNIPRMGYFIVFKHSKGWIGNQIVKQQLKMLFSEEHAQYTHVGVSLGGPDFVEVAPPKTKVIDFTRKHKGRYCKIVKYNQADYHRNRYKVAVWAGTKNNALYDPLGVLRFKFWFMKQIKGWYFCSEHSLFSLQKAYPNALGIKPHECMPAHFLDEKYFTVVFEGLV